MSEAAIVDGHYMGVGLQGQVAVGICSPALGDMTSVAMDFFAVALSAILSSGIIDWRGSSQLITTRAGVEVDESSSNGKVFVKSSTGP